jgi:hypothetical protein
MKAAIQAALAGRVAAIATADIDDLSVAEEVNHLPLVPLDGGKVKGRLSGLNAQALQFLESGKLPAAGQKRLGGYAAAMGAGAAPEILFDNGHPGAAPGGALRHGMAARSSPDHDYIKGFCQNRNLRRGCSGVAFTESLCR